jgi:hypothetical protein
MFMLAAAAASQQEEGEGDSPLGHLIIWPNFRPPGSCSFAHIVQGAPKVFARIFLGIINVFLFRPF